VPKTGHTSSNAARNQDLITLPVPLNAPVAASDRDQQPA
jgi:hypothetical protein